MDKMPIKRYNKSEEDKKLTNIKIVQEVQNVRK